MVALPQENDWTIEQYLAFEQEQDERHEFIMGQVYAMAGASERHNQIASSLHYLLYGQLLERQCQVFQSDMRVQVLDSASFYPDIVAICGEAHYSNDRRDTLLNPTVIIEVLSPSTEAHDRGSKFKQYRRLASLKEYALVSQHQIQIDHYTRQNDDTWVLTDFSDASDSLELDSINCLLLLSDIYRKVNFGQSKQNDESQS